MPKSAKQPDCPCELVGAGVGVDVGGNGVIGVAHNFLQVFGPRPSFDHHACKGVTRGMQRTTGKILALQKRVVLPVAEVVGVLLPALDAA